MIGKTLAAYLAWKFAKNMLAMLLALLFLIVTVDFVELLRKSAEIDDVSIGQLYMISFFKAPIFLEKAFPFGCLFAAMMTLTQLNQKLELVVARAAGVSAWQFLLPIAATAAVIGLAAAMLYNPVAIMAQAKSKELQAEVFDAKARAKSKAVNGYWIRQESKDGSEVIHANLAREEGKVLSDVMVITFDTNDKVTGRFDAKSGKYMDDHWLLSGVKHTNQAGLVENHAKFEIQTRLTADVLLGAGTAPDSISFWNLANAAERVRLAGGNPLPFQVQYHVLLSTPVFLVAMVIIAAVVSLKFVRFGQVGRMILGGIFSGFVLYTAISLITSLGNNGIVPPAFAAWAPACVAILFGSSILLHQEDG